MADGKSYAVLSVPYKKNCLPRTISLFQLTLFLAVSMCILYSLRSIWYSSADVSRSLFLPESIIPTGPYSLPERFVCYHSGVAFRSDVTLFNLVLQMNHAR